MTEGLAKVLGSTFRDPDKLISGVARHLMREEETDRRSDCIHPSEASHEGWCPRSTYYRIAGAQAEPIPRKMTFEIQLETGSDAHKKWQGWFREMGILKGMWMCTWCRLLWEDTSPRSCPRCEHGEDLIVYAEVPVHNDHYLLAGNADGDVIWPGGNRLIEVKTIGTGTVRIEAPKMMEQFTFTHVDIDGKSHTVVDWYALWQAIRRPFPSHIRQGMIYDFCAGREWMTFIYDPKFVTAYPKEFDIKFRLDIIEPILEECLRVKNALEAQRPPKRPHWAQITHAKCKECPYRRVCWGDRAEKG